MGTAKKNGNAAEEIVARRFTRWTGIKYKRRTGSGAADNHDSRVRGDVAPLFPSPFTIFSIEVKNRTTKNINELTFSSLQEGYEQAVKDAMEYRIPIVVIRDKNKNLFMLISDVWLLRIIQLTKINTILNLRVTYSKRYSQSIVWFDKFIEKVSYDTLKQNRHKLNLQKIDDLNLALQFAINIDQPYHYELMTIPQYVEYYNNSYPQRKKINRSHVFYALENALIHGFVMKKADGATKKLVALTPKTTGFKFRYKTSKK